jgi:sugar diacid utilization regulator
VQAALDKLRARLGEGERIDFAELVRLGAQVKARRLADQDEQARRARREMIDWILNGNGPKVDLDAAAEVKHLGLIARYDDE